MTPEELLFHRDLELLRAAGKIRKHGNNTKARKRTKERSVKLAQAQRIIEKEVRKKMSDQKRIQAKVKVNEITKTEYAETVKMNPVYSDDPSDENHSYSQATPSGEIKLAITNPSALGVFEVGKEYIVDFTPA